jgi:hypothetical protein
MKRRGRGRDLGGKGRKQVCKVCTACNDPHQDYVIGRSGGVQRASARYQGNVSPYRPDLRTWAEECVRVVWRVQGGAT